MTEEEAKQAVIDAAVKWHAGVGVSASALLGDAVERYHKATTPPEPFEAYLGRSGDGSLANVAFKHSNAALTHYREVWRCTVTPIERVRR